MNGKQLRQKVIDELDLEPSVDSARVECVTSIPPTTLTFAIDVARAPIERSRSFVL